MTRPAGSPRVAIRVAGVGLLIAANIALTAFCWFPPRIIRRSPWGDSFEVAAEMLLLAQVVLIALWLAWSDLKAPLRWLIGAVVLAALIVSASRYAAWVSLRSPDPLIGAGVIGGVALLAAHAMLLPLRWLCAWRLTFGGVEPAPARRGRFTTQQWLAWCLALGLPLAATQPASEPAAAAGKIAVMLLFVAPLVASAVPAAFSRRWWLWSLVAVGWTIPAGLVLGEGYWQYLLSRKMGFGGMHRSILWTFAASPALITTAIIANLLLLRALGMGWVNVADAAAGTVGPLRKGTLIGTDSRK
jgi:hypothetical protein